MRVTGVLVVALYAVTYILYNANHQSSIHHSQEIVYQNLIIGAIAKQSALVSELQLMAGNRSSENPQRLVSIFSDNLKYLEQIQLLGTTPFPFTYSIDSVSQTSLTSQYISTIINYASTLHSSLEGAVTQ
jgi:hypothetical protein